MFTVIIRRITVILISHQKCLVILLNLNYGFDSDKCCYISKKKEKKVKRKKKNEKEDFFGLLIYWSNDFFNYIMFGLKHQLNLLLKKYIWFFLITFLYYVFLKQHQLNLLLQKLWMIFLINFKIFLLKLNQVNFFIENKSYRWFFSID